MDVLAALLVFTALSLVRSNKGFLLATWPATVLHELAHWLIALITGSRPGAVTLWPKKTQGGYELGSVAFEPGRWSGGLVALAPLWVLGPSALYLLVHRPASAALSHELFWGVVAAYCLSGCLPSAQDWTIAIRYPLGALLVLVVGALVLMAWAPEWVARAIS